MSLLVEAGYRPQRVAQEAPEVRLPEETPEAMVVRLACDKARWALKRLPPQHPVGIVVGADTAVVLGDTVLGKPVSDEAARRMLGRLSGHRHRVLTGVALIRSRDGREVSAVETTQVEFHRVTPEAIERYVAGGSTSDKAGAYGIQDLDDTWIAAIDGLRSNVIGLPVERLAGWISTLQD